MIKVKRIRNRVYYPGEVLEECIFLEETHTNKGGNRFAKFKCKCGNEFIAAISKVKIRHTKSCGCISAETKPNLKHGLANSSEYNTWNKIKGRCFNPKDEGFSDYGGRGITMCDEWKNSFEAFYNYVGKKPEGKYSMDRINNEGNYEPGNVRWATDIEQANNKRNNRIIEYKGEKKTISEWAEIVGINRTVLARRYDLGWTDEQILNIPMRQRAS